MPADAHPSLKLSDHSLTDSLPICLCLQASDVVKKGKMCALFINDLDAGAGRIGSNTQYTVSLLAQRNSVRGALILLTQ